DMEIKNDDDGKSQSTTLVAYELSDFIRNPPSNFTANDYFDLIHSGAIPILIDDLQSKQQQQDFQDCLEKLLDREIKNEKSKLEPQSGPPQLEQLHTAQPLSQKTQTNKNDNNNSNQESQPVTEIKNQDTLKEPVKEN